MSDYISLSSVLKLSGYLLGPIYDFFGKRARLFLYLDKILIGASPLIPYRVDQITWHGELVIKNNSRHDAYDLKFVDQITSVFNLIEKLSPHNNLSAKSELRLKFKWVRNYVNKPTAQIFRQHKPEYQFPFDRREFVLTLEYENERGKKFYTQFLKSKFSTKSELKFFKP